MNDAPPPSPMTTLARRMMGVVQPVAGEPVRRWWQGWALPLGIVALVVVLSTRKR